MSWPSSGGDLAGAGAGDVARVGAPGDLAVHDHRVDSLLVPDPPDAAAGEVEHLVGAFSAFPVDYDFLLLNPKKYAL